MNIRASFFESQCL